MSEYVERYVRLGHEISWGTYASPASFDPIYYCLGFDATTTEERIEEDLISTSRQAISRVYTQRAVVGAFESNYLSPHLLFYALGSVSAADTVTPYTVTIGGEAILESFSIERGLQGQTELFYTGYMGCKVDRYELIIESEEDITQTVDWVGKDSTFPAYAGWGTVAPGGTFTYDPLAYHKACLVWGTSTIGFRRFRLEINNNLVPRYSGSCTAGDPTPDAIREGRQAITGDFMIDYNISTFATEWAKGRTEGTIQVTIGDDTLGTITIDIGKVALDEYADSIRGRDPYEVSFPFTARPTGLSYYDSITAVWTNTIAGDIYEAPI